ncbi:MAG: phosphoribosyltransferase [Candidatus Methanofastidiosum sp.]|nr:phosphoribosyltransferase [Methanofastidiosum sp.]
MEDFHSIFYSLKEFKIPFNFDIIVGIARGGIIPSSILSFIYEKELFLLWLNLYGEGMPPERVHDKPKLMRPFDHDLSGKRVLLVDDLSRSGETIEFAKKILKEKGASGIKSLVLVGKGDYFLQEFKGCVNFPWKF